jgi:AAA15 family ATPase/GTPase
MERRDPFISRVRLKNYKSIAACDVRLGPFTVLIGPNGSGKSNFLDALAFLARRWKPRRPRHSMSVEG